jgi:hypothetical protein
MISQRSPITPDRPPLACLRITRTPGLPSEAQHQLVRPARPTPNDETSATPHPPGYENSQQRDQARPVPGAEAGCPGEGWLGFCHSRFDGTPEPGGMPAGPASQKPANGGKQQDL